MINNINIYDDLLFKVELGKEWFNLHYGSSLKHYGVKGMKWGIRKDAKRKTTRGVEVKLSKNTVIQDAISSGLVSNKLKKEAQEKHILGSKRYDYEKHRSYLKGDLDYAQKLIYKLGGTGTPVYSNSGEWSRKERVKADEVIGVHVDMATGAETDTSNAIIVYSKAGAHIFPAKKEKSDGT